MARQPLNFFTEERRRVLEDIVDSLSEACIQNIYKLALTSFEFDYI